MMALQSTGQPFARLYAWANELVYLNDRVEPPEWVLVTDLWRQGFDATEHTVVFT